MDISTFSEEDNEEFDAKRNCTALDHNNRDKLSRQVAREDTSVVNDKPGELIKEQAEAKKEKEMAPEEQEHSDDPEQRSSDGGHDKGEERML